MKGPDPWRGIRSGVHSTKDERAFGARLANEVRAQHGSRCPCCARTMTWRKKHERHSVRATVGHDAPFRTDPMVWVWVCQRCNAQQGTLTFAQWAVVLALAGDARAEAVHELAATIAAWRER